MKATCRLRPCLPCNADRCDGPTVVEDAPHGTLVHCAGHVANVDSALVHVQPSCAGRLEVKGGVSHQSLTRYSKLVARCRNSSHPAQGRG